MSDGTFSHAIENNDAKTVRRMLEESPNPRALLERNDLCSLSASNLYNVIPVIAEFFPDLLDRTNTAGKKPLHVAAETFTTESMLALAAAGADVHATTAAGDDAMHLACKASHNIDKGHARKHLVALRSLGLDINAPHPIRSLTPLQHSLRESKLKNIISQLEAGANVYKALGIPAPADPFHPARHAITGAFNKICSRFEPNINEVRSNLVKYIYNTISAAPASGAALSCERFLHSNGTLRDEVHCWESVGLLPCYFNSEAASRWNGGIEEMIATAHHLPLHLEENINLPAIKRLAHSPHEDSVTVAYTKNKLPQRHGRND